MEGAILAVVLIAFLSILYHHAKTGVPPVPATTEEIARVIALLRTAGLPPHAKIYELGCGWGSLVLGLARAFPEATIVGYELSPLPYLIAKLRARGRCRILIERRDYLEASLEDADAVTAYLMIKPMEKLALHLDRSLREGTPVVALCFCFRDRKPITRERLRKLGNEAALYRWPAKD
jgi:tRNA A58 N-methylase Trm61